MILRSKRLEKHPFIRQECLEPKHSFLIPPACRTEVSSIINIKGIQTMDDTKTFAEMFEESYATPKRYSVGEKVEATIVKISPEWIFIDLGAHLFHQTIIRLNNFSALFIMIFSIHIFMADFL